MCETHQPSNGKMKGLWLKSSEHKHGSNETIILSLQCLRKVKTTTEF